MSDIKYNENYDVEHDPVDDIEPFSIEVDHEWNIMALNIDLAGAMYDLQRATIDEGLCKRDFEKYVSEVKKAETDLAEIAIKLSTYAIGLGRKQ